ncbi:MAG: hypothetical protein KJO69_10940 [Gammaproteobacteria bacterium]|nr:hypothetical protein [Gammaproteobacteria bacterium]
MSYYGQQLEYGNYPTDKFTGDGTTKIFNLSTNPASPNAVMAWVNDVIQDPLTDYSIVGNQIVFGTAPSNTHTILVRSLGQQLQIGTPSPDSIGSVQLQSGYYFVSGTKALFQQTSAPTGWTKDTTHNNKSLRVVTGTAGSGGTSAFTTVFGAGKTAGSHTLTSAQIPAHTHPASSGGAGAHNHSGLLTSNSGTVSQGYNRGANLGTITPLTAAGNHTHTVTVSNNTGGGGSHNHSLSLDVQYVDTIIATRD